MCYDNEETFFATKPTIQQPRVINLEHEMRLLLEWRVLHQEEVIDYVLKRLKSI